MKKRLYSFWWIKSKYPRHLGNEFGTNKQEAFETLKRRKGYNPDLRLGKKVEAVLAGT